MNWLKLRLMTKSVTSLMKFPKDRNTLMMNTQIIWKLWWKVWLVWWNFPKTEIHLKRKMWIVWWNFPQHRNTLMSWNFPKTEIYLQIIWIVWWNFPKKEIHLQWKVWQVWWNFSKTKIHLQRTMSIVWCNFPKTEIHLWWKVSIVWWNLHQLSDSHTGCTSIPLPNHMENIKGGLVVGQWEQNGGAHWSNCRCLPPYS